MGSPQSIPAINSKASPGKKKPKKKPFSANTIANKSHNPPFWIKYVGSTSWKIKFTTSITIIKACLKSRIPNKKSLNPGHGFRMGED